MRRATVNVALAPIDIDAHTTPAVPSSDNTDKEERSRTRKRASRILRALSFTSSQKKATDESDSKESESAESTQDGGTVRLHRGLNSIKVTIEMLVLAVRKLPQPGNDGKRVFVSWRRSGKSASGRTKKGALCDSKGDAQWFVDAAAAQRPDADTTRSGSVLTCTLYQNQRNHSVFEEKTVLFTVSVANATDSTPSSTKKVVGKALVNVAQFHEHGVVAQHSIPIKVKGEHDMEIVMLVLTRWESINGESYAAPSNPTTVQRLLRPKLNLMTISYDSPPQSPTSMAASIDDSRSRVHFAGSGGSTPPTLSSMRQRSQSAAPIYRPSDLDIDMSLPVSRSTTQTAFATTPLNIASATTSQPPADTKKPRRNHRKRISDPDAETPKLKPDVDLRTTAELIASEQAVGKPALPLPVAAVTAPRAFLNELPAPTTSTSPSPPPAPRVAASSGALPDRHIRSLPALAHSHAPTPTPADEQDFQERVIQLEKREAEIEALKNRCHRAEAELEVTRVILEQEAQKLAVRETELNEQQSAIASGSQQIANHHHQSTSAPTDDTMQFIVDVVLLHLPPVPSRLISFRKGSPNIAFSNSLRSSSSTNVSVPSNDASASWTVTIEAQAARIVAQINSVPPSSSATTNTHATTTRAICDAIITTCRRSEGNMRVLCYWLATMLHIAKLLQAQAPNSAIPRKEDADHLPVDRRIQQTTLRPERNDNVALEVVAAIGTVYQCVVDSLCIVCHTRHCTLSFSFWFSFSFSLFMICCCCYNQ
jgi:hypothetical protein